MMLRLLGVAAAGLLLLQTQMSLAQSTSNDNSAATAAPQRPAILGQRWEEDWSSLADPALQTEPLDSLKYIPLFNDGQMYLSLGANARERFESIDAPMFGTTHQKSNSYLLDRLEVSADLRYDGWQTFVQLEDAEAPGKNPVTPPDADRLDVEQAFIAHVGTVGDGVLKVRVGRQEFGFDQQRFVSDRDGPNVRQAYDALWADYEIGNWRIISFVSHPTQYKNDAIFDDYSDNNLVLDGFRIERRALGPGNLAVYYLRYQRNDASLTGVVGNERRNILDVHYAGKQGPIDFDLEGMGQQGEIGDRPILAWAFGSRVGYTFSNTGWVPNLALQFDSASGNTSRTGTFGTFNPLFPNGQYFSLAGFTGDSNLIHIKPIFSVSPTKTLMLQAALGFQWRETTQDSIYTFPVQPVPDTAGKGSLWTGAYLQLDAVKKINDNVTLSTEYEHYQVGSTIKQAGGHDSDYFMLQISMGW